MIVWVALAMALGLALLSLRTMAHAFSVSVGPVPSVPMNRAHSAASVRHERFGQGQVWMMCVEIAFSVGITLMILGLALAAAMPGHLLVGALLAQVAVVGSLVAPVYVVNIGGIGIRPAAIALGVAQLAHAAFFIRAFQALLG
ncbi:hypothetical protein BH23CHL1_BH23CHL1_23760 [soil metagenome]